MTIKDLIPNFDELLVKAEAAGQHTCKACGFVYYKVTDVCPKPGCHFKRPTKQA